MPADGDTIDIGDLPACLGSPAQSAVNAVPDGQAAASSSLDEQERLLFQRAMRTAGRDALRCKLKKHGIEKAELRGVTH